MKDWVAWHTAYDDPASPLRRRLRVVRGHLSDALDAAPPGPVRLVSLCAGQGHDVLGVLPAHPRGPDVSAVLVEYNAQNAALARRGAEQAGLPQVQVREADAARVANYADALPADVLLLCGIFGNVSDADIERTAQAAPALCAPGATVIWTRNRRAPDLTPQIRAWFQASGFDEVAFDVPDEALPGISVGVGRLAVTPPAWLPAGPVFTFRTA
ncbi:MAG TPA: SAM-dependent methyltransferase [Streptosporangiaceae bacterium]